MYDVPTPSGTVRVREPGEVPARARRAVQARVLAVGLPRLVQVMSHGRDVTTEQLADLVGLTGPEQAAVEALSVAAVLAVTDGWTRPEPLPATVEAAQALPGTVLDDWSTAALDEAARLLQDQMGL